MKWKEIEIADPKPKPRRRHSALFVCGQLAMFGGFDGNFFNDLNILDLQGRDQGNINLSPSNIAKDYWNLVGKPEGADVCFILNDQK